MVCALFIGVQRGNIDTRNAQQVYRPTYCITQIVKYVVGHFETENAYDNHNSDPTRGLSEAVKAYVRKKFSEGIRKPIISYWLQSEKSPYVSLTRQN